MCLVLEMCSLFLKSMIHLQRYISFLKYMFHFQRYASLSNICLTFKYMPHFQRYVSLLKICFIFQISASFSNCMINFQNLYSNCRNEIPFSKNVLWHKICLKDAHNIVSLVFCNLCISYRNTILKNVLFELSRIG